jgi:hypothetical protein
MRRETAGLLDLYRNYLSRLLRGHWLPDRADVQRRIET